MDDVKNIIRCSACNGAKQVITLGNIIKDCAICDGIGHTNKEMMQKQPYEKRVRKQKIVGNQ